MEKIFIREMMKVSWCWGSSCVGWEVLNNEKMTPLSGNLARYTRNLLRFGYLGKWSPCACESLSTKGETITLVLCTLCLISL
jgi:hypothetical protein